MPLSTYINQVSLTLKHREVVILIKTVEWKHNKLNTFVH